MIFSEIFIILEIFIIIMGINLTLKIKLLSETIIMHILFPQHVILQ